MSKTSNNCIIAIVIVFVGLFFIAIFAAILYPVFAKAREKARIACCRSNLSAIYISLKNYSVANGGKLPNASDDKWVDLAGKYIKDKVMLQCPGDREETANKTDYIIAPNAAGKPLSSLPDKIILMEKNPYHKQFILGVLGNGNVIELQTNIK